MASRQAKALELVLRAQRLRGQGLRGQGLGAHRRTAERLAKEFAGGVLRPRSFAPPAALDDLVDLSVSLVEGQRLYRVSPRLPSTTSDGDVTSEGELAAYAGPTVLLLHGGGYVGEVGERQWSLAAELVTRLAATVFVPIYPLAPLEGAADGVPRCARLVQSLTQQHGPMQVVGDSAGAGLALATLLLAATSGDPLPEKAVLISPWLDAAMDHPRTKALATRDPMLDLDSLRLGGLAWAGDLPVEDPLVSPLNGDLSSLAGVQFLVQSGTSDLLNHDSRRFVAAARALGVDVRFVEREGLLHAYPLFAMPEGQVGRDEIVDFLS